jgi:hypothetical protein
MKFGTPKKRINIKPFKPKKKRTTLWVSGRIPRVQDKCQVVINSDINWKRHPSSDLYQAININLHVPTICQPFPHSKDDPLSISAPRPGANAWPVAVAEALRRAVVAQLRKAGGFSNHVIIEMITIDVHTYILCM